MLADSGAVELASDDARAFTNSARRCGVRACIAHWRQACSSLKYDAASAAKEEGPWKETALLNLVWKYIYIYIYIYGTRPQG